MLAIKARIKKGLPHGASLTVCDNSGAKVLKLVSIIGAKTVKGRAPAAGVGDLILGSVRKGKPEMRKQIVYAIVVRQRAPYRRPDGTRVAFEDNAAVVLKDEKGSPKGTLIKGPIAKEAALRWPALAKIAVMVL